MVSLIFIKAPLISLTGKSDWKKEALKPKPTVNPNPIQERYHIVGEGEDGGGTAQEDVATGGTASLQNQGAQDENLKPTIKPTMGNTQGQVGGTPPGMENIERPDLMQAIWDERAQEAQDWVGIGNGAELISTPEPKTKPDIPESLKTGKQGAQDLGGVGGEDLDKTINLNVTPKVAEQVAKGSVEKGAQYDPAQGENNTAQSNQSLLGQNNP